MFAIKRRSTFIKRRSPLMYLGAMLGATALVALGITTADNTVKEVDPASAHTGKDYADCKAFYTDQDSYAASQNGKWNTITVTIDGKVVLDKKQFGSSYSNSFPFADKIHEHTWKVQVTAWDSNHYGYTNSGKSTPCAPDHVPANPQLTKQVVCGSVTFTFSNPITMGKNEVGDNAGFSYSDANGVTQNVTVKPGETVSKTVSFPEDSGTKTVSYGVTGKPLDTVTVETDCSPNQVPNNPKVDKQLVCGSVTFTVTNQVILGKNDVAADAVFGYTDADGASQTLKVPANETRTVTVAFPEDSGSKTVTYGFVGQDQQKVDVVTDCQPNHVASNGQLKADKVCGALTLTGTNVVELKENDKADDAVFTYTDAEGKVQEFTVKPNESKSVTIAFPEDSGSKSVTYGVKDGEQTTETVQTDCQPNVPPVQHTTPASFTLHDSCDVTDDSVTAPGEPTTSDDPNFAFSSTVKEGTYYWNTTIEKGHYVSFDGGIFVPNDGYALNEPGTGDTYKLVDGIAVWGSYTFETEPCATETPKPTPTPSVTPTPGHTPSATPTPSKSPAPAVVVPHNGTPPKGGTLAFTGSDVPVAPLLGGAAAVVMLGLALLAIRRRKVSEAVVSEANQE